MAESARECIRSRRIPLFRRLRQEISFDCCSDFRIRFQLLPRKLVKNCIQSSYPLFSLGQYIVRVVAIVPRFIALCRRLCIYKPFCMKNWYCLYKQRDTAVLILTYCGNKMLFSAEISPVFVRSFVIIITRLLCLYVNPDRPEMKNR